MTDTLFNISFSLLSSCSILLKCPLDDCKVTVVRNIFSSTFPIAHDAIDFHRYSSIEATTGHYLLSFIIV